MRLPSVLGAVVLLSLLVVSTPVQADEQGAASEPQDLVITIVGGTVVPAEQAAVGEEAAGEEAAGEEAAGVGQPCVDSGECADAESCTKEPAKVADGAGATEEPGQPHQERMASTHKQTKVIAVNRDEMAKVSLRSFCLSPDGSILAACGGAPSEVRLFSPTGEYRASWELPFDPEAINVGADGNVYVAGDGKLLRLSSAGEVLLEAKAPHVNVTSERRDRIRQSIIKQQKSMTERFVEMNSEHEQRYEELNKAAKVLEANNIPLTSAQKKRVELAKDMADRWKQVIDQMRARDKGAKEMTEEELEQRVESSIKELSKVASISESDGEVFLATREETGYAYCVWRMSSDFEGGEVIVGGLRGCCGQMDVQCCENGVYIAENSRHRVYHVSRTGEEFGQWGHSSREGVEGFGSCCNPMNVAFGPERSVYTAESGTGRIKRYSPEGELLDLVGKVDIVPGCEKVSIAVAPSGDRIYMLDITRNHIVLMERLGEGEESSYTELRAAKGGKAADAGGDEAIGGMPAEG